MGDLGRIRMSILCLIGWFIALLCMSATVAQTQPLRSRTKTKVPQSKPFTLERLIARLHDVADKEYTEAALLKKIEKDGIDFTATAPNVLKLREAGGSDSLLGIVRRLGPPPAVLLPPVVRLAPTGTVEVTCMPTECLVGFGEEPEVVAANGKRIRLDLATGNISIRVTKKGFIPWAGSAEVKANAKTSITAVLKPNLQTQQLWGIQLKDQIMQAVGLHARSQDSRTLLSLGDTTIWGHDGRKYTSSLEMLLRNPDKAFFRTRAGKHSTFEVEFFPTFRSKTNLREEEARDTEAGLRLFLKYQISALMDRLALPGIELIAETNQARDGVELLCKSSTVAFVVVLDSDGRPKEVREEQPVGLGIHAHYSAYRLLGKEYLPAEISVVWAGSPKQGIAVRLQKFEFNPNLKNDSGYRLRRSGR